MGWRYHTRPRLQRLPKKYTPVYAQEGGELPTDLRKAIDRYFFTIDPTPALAKRLDSMTRDEALELLRKPEAFRVIVKTCSNNHQAEGIRGLIAGQTVEHLPILLMLKGSSVDATFDERTIWEREVAELREARKNASTRLGEIEGKLLAIDQMLDILKSALTDIESVRCATSTSVMDVNSRLAVVFRETSEFLAAVATDALPVVIKRDTIDGKNVRRDFNESRQRIMELGNSLNDMIDELNKAIFERYRFFKCRACILKDFVNTYYDSWRRIRWLRLWASKDFPDVKKEEAEKAKRMATEVEEARGLFDRKLEEYFGFKMVSEAYASNEGKIRTVNYGIASVNREIQNLRRVIERMKKSDKPNGPTPPNFKSENDDPRSAETMIRVLEQMKTLKAYYRARFTDMRVRLGIARDALTEMKDSCQRIIEQCESTEKAVGEFSGVYPYDVVKVPIANIQPARLEGDQQEVVDGRLRYPEEAVVLCELVLLHQENHEPFVLDLMQFRNIDRLLDEDLGVDDIIRNLKMLRRNQVYRQLLTSDTAVLERLLEANVESATTKAVLAIYRSRRGLCCDLERELHRRAMADLLSKKRRQMKIIAGKEVTREQLVAKYGPRLGAFLESLDYLVRPNDGYVEGHAAKHAGHKFRIPIETDRKEAILWERIRNGSGPFSLSELGLKPGDTLGHYAKVSRMTAIHGTPFLAGFGYEFIEPGVRPRVFFLRDLAEDGVAGHYIFTGFGFEANGIMWRTTFITEGNEFLEKGNISLITPIPKTTLI